MTGDDFVWYKLLLFLYSMSVCKCIFLTECTNINRENILSGFGWRFSCLFETGRSNDDIRVLGGEGGGWQQVGGTMGGTAGCRVTCLQPYSTFTIPAHPLGVKGRETAATVAAVRTVYPFLPVSESECRYFYRHISVSPNVLRNLGFSQKLHIFFFSKYLLTNRFF